MDPGSLRYPQGGGLNVRLEVCGLGLSLTPRGVGLDYGAPKFSF